MIEDIEHLHATVERLLEIIKNMSLTPVDTFKQFKDFISVDTLKAMQLLGFNYKAAIGEPLTKKCAEAIANIEINHTRINITSQIIRENKRTKGNFAMTNFDFLESDPQFEELRRCGYRSRKILHIDLEACILNCRRRWNLPSNGCIPWTVPCFAPIRIRWSV